MPRRSAVFLPDPKCSENSDGYFRRRDGGQSPMRALVVAPAVPGEVRLAEVAEPAAGPHQVLVEVHHASLNYGDLNDARSGRVPPGAVLGSDAAGVGAESAADGSGPTGGMRV